MCFVNSEDNLRSGCDLMHAFFVIDAYTDKMDTSNARDVCNAAIDAISYPEKLRPEGENIVGEICRQ